MTEGRGRSGGSLRRAERRCEARICDMGGNAFSWTFHLGLLKRTHTGERLHACDTCRKSFSRAKTGLGFRVQVSALRVRGLMVDG